MSSLPAESVDNVGVLQFPTGVVLPYLGTGQPTGWYLLKIGGAIELINDYPTLFGLLGTRYGGNGVTTFGTPPAELYLRGPDGSHALWSTFGEDTHTLTTAEVPATPTDSPGIKVPNDGNNNGPYAAVQVISQTTPTSYSGPGYVEPIAGGGGGGAHNNLPRTHAVNFIVKT